MKLPRNLMHVAKAADEEMFAPLDGVELKSDGAAYSAVASDGVAIVRVTGIATDETPQPTTIVPARRWRKVLKRCSLHEVEVRTEGNVTTVSCESAHDTFKAHIHNLGGKFPKYEHFLGPETAPAATFKVNPYRLIELLKIAREYTDESVVIEVHGWDEPIVVRAGCDGQEFTGALMQTGTPEEVAEYNRRMREVAAAEKAKV